MEHRYLRTALVAVGCISLLVAAGLCLQLPWATILWPWVDSSVPYLFLGAIGAAIGASLLWIGFSGELGAAVGGAIDLTVGYGGLALALSVLSRQARDPRFGQGAIACLVGALAAGGLWLWFRHYPIRDRRPLPRTVRASFVAYVVLLAGAGVANLARIPNAFPWALHPTTSALVGCTFLGSAWYFLYSVLIPVWRNACAQLWGFLAYDAVLIGPMLAHFGSVQASLMPALVLNTAVLLYSGALAAYYLIVNQATRQSSWADAKEPGPPPAAVTRPAPCGHEAPRRSHAAPPVPLAQR